MRCVQYLCGAVASLLVAASAEAATISLVEEIPFFPGPGYTLQLFVSGGEPVFGLDLYLQINDGGGDLGGSATAPVITDIDLLTGTIFAANNAGQTDSTVYPMAYGGSTTTNTGTVPADGLLATITLDCSALSEGDVPFVLMAKGVAGAFDTQLTDGDGNPITLNMPSAWLIPIPEPASLLALTALGTVVLLRPCGNRA